MKILILEDSPERIKIFKQKLKNNDLYFFDNVEDAKNAVELLGHFDYFFIDHDLGDKIFVDSNELNTGYQFAKYLAENKIQGNFITHTLNNAGALNIINVLPECIYIPFTELFK